MLSQLGARTECLFRCNNPCLMRLTGAKTYRIVGYNFCSKTFLLLTSKIDKNNGVLIGSGQNSPVKSMARLSKDTGDVTGPT